MNVEQLAFANQQLAGMLRAGVPLEGGLRQVCAQMARGGLRDELQQLEAALGRGVPIEEALAARRLPDFYRRMVIAGFRSGDLPGVLMMTADYYHHAHAVWTRLKGMMVYPAIVLAASLVLSAFLALSFGPSMAAFLTEMTGGSLPPIFHFCVWFPFVVLCAMTLTAAGWMSSSGMRQAMRWRLPAFREASLAELAQVLALMLKSGCPLPDAVAWARQLEQGSPAGETLAAWERGLRAGAGQLKNVHDAGRVLPPMFVAMVAAAGDDLAAALFRAGEFYRARAMYRIEMMLFAALPASVLVLGVMIAVQVIPVFMAMAQMLRAMAGT